VIGRVSGPPGNDSSMTRWAKAGVESSASPPRPAVPSRERRVIEVPALVIGASARPDTVTYCQVQTPGKSRPSINQLLHSSFQSLKIRNHVLTIFGVRDGDEHLRAVHVARWVLEPLIERLLIPRDVCRLERG
jgi:hypothetical protein